VRKIIKITHFNNDSSVRGIHTLYDEYHGRLRRAGHVMRMGESDPAKKVLCATPGGSGDRGRGRPQLRRCDELGAEIGELMHSQGRSGWYSVRR
jgi:hypothetical protein